jgi:hypothetical protein
MILSITTWELTNGFTVDLSDQAGQLVYATPICARISDAMLDVALWFRCLEETEAAFANDAEVA